MTTDNSLENAQNPTRDNGEQTPQKNKGGRPSGRPSYGNNKLNIYLSDEDYNIFMTFFSKGWNGHNKSSAGRHLLITALQDWQRKGAKKITY
jgi:hypothetical protein